MNPDSLAGGPQAGEPAEARAGACLWQENLHRLGVGALRAPLPPTPRPSTRLWASGSCGCPCRGPKPPVPMARSLQDALVQDSERPTAHGKAELGACEVRAHPGGRRHADGCGRRGGAGSRGCGSSGSWKQQGPARRPLGLSPGDPSRTLVPRLCDANLWSLVQQLQEMLTLASRTLMGTGNAEGPALGHTGLPRHVAQDAVTSQQHTGGGGDPAEELGEQPAGTGPRA